MKQEEKFKELIDKLEGLELIQITMDWQENIPKDIWVNYFKDNFSILKQNLDVDTHRWYETSVSVIEIYGIPLGITHISNIFSESSSCEDFYFTIEFFRMEEILTKSYRQL